MKTKLVNGVRIEMTPEEISWLPQSPTDAQIAEALAAEARTQRNGLLAASDWTQVADAPVDQAAWANYRQALRDITGQAGFPTSIAWPVAPE